MAMPGFALVAVVILSVVGKHSLSEPDFLTKGHTSGFPCDIEIVQACGAGSADFHVENVLAADAVTVRPGTPVFFRASCPNAASLTIQDINGQQVIISDLTSAQMALLTSQGNKIQWQPVASNLQFAFGDVVMTIKMQLSSDVCQ